MPIIDCSCKGINPDCERCMGRGYYDSEEIGKISFVKFAVKESKVANTTNKYPRRSKRRKSPLRLSGKSTSNGKKYSSVTVQKSLDSLAKKINVLSDNGLSALLHRLSMTIDLKTEAQLKLRESLSGDKEIDKPRRIQINSLLQEMAILKKKLEIVRRFSLHRVRLNKNP
ncbi:MAG: hypothetical protein AB2L20_12165 [Mangrovibacterium sp.]